MQHLERLKGGVVARLSNVTCALRKMGLVAADGLTPDVTSVKAEFDNLEVDAATKEDLKRGVEQCASYASCLPVDETLGQRVGPIVAFANCLRAKKTEACVKRDLRLRLKDFSIFAVDEAQPALGREGGEDEAATLEAFLTAMLYEDEPKEILFR